MLATTGKANGPSIAKILAAPSAAAAAPRVMLLPTDEVVCCVSSIIDWIAIANWKSR